MAGDGALSALRGHAAQTTSRVLGQELRQTTGNKSPPGLYIESLLQRRDMSNPHPDPDSDPVG